MILELHSHMSILETSAESQTEIQSTLHEAGDFLHPHLEIFFYSLS